MELDLNAWAACNDNNNDNNNKSLFSEDYILSTVTYLTYVPL